MASKSERSTCLCLPCAGTKGVCCHSLLSINFLRVYFSWMDILPACMAVRHVHALCLWRPKEDSGIPGTWWVWAAMWVLGIEPGPLEEQSVLSTSEPFLQFGGVVVWCGFNHITATCWGPCLEQNCWIIGAAVPSACLSVSHCSPKRTINVRSSPSQSSYSSTSSPGLEMHGVCAMPFHLLIVHLDFSSVTSSFSSLMHCESQVASLLEMWNSVYNLWWLLTV